MRPCKRVLMSGPASRPTGATATRAASSVAPDASCIADDIRQRQGEFMVVDVFDVTAAGIGGRAHGPDRSTCQRQELAVTEYTGDSGSSVDVVADS